MATKVKVPTLTESEFIDEVTKRLDGEYSRGAVATVLRAIKVEIIDCVVNGYKINLAGLASFEPQLKSGRKKGTVIRNPFDPDAPEKKLRADEPDKFVFKVGKSSAVAKRFPPIKSSAGKALAAQLPRK